MRKFELFFGKIKYLTIPPIIITWILLFNCTSTYKNKSAAIPAANVKYTPRYYVIRNNSTKVIDSIIYGKPPNGQKSFTWDSLQIFLKDSCKINKKMICGQIIKGKRKIDDLKNILGEKNPEIRYTYNRFLKIDPNINGRIVFMISVSGKGDVVDVCEYSSKINSSALVDSLISKISHWKFCQISNELDTTIYVYPFEFYYPKNEN